jgi:hypothetical protein
MPIPMSNISQVDDGRLQWCQLRTYPTIEILRQKYNITMYPVPSGEPFFESELAYKDLRSCLLYHLSHFTITINHITFIHLYTMHG